MRLPILILIGWVICVPVKAAEAPAPVLQAVHGEIADPKPTLSFSVRHPIIHKAGQISIMPITVPGKAFGKTKPGKIIYKEAAALEHDTSVLLIKVNDKLSPYSSAMGLGASGFSLWNTVRLMSVK